VLENGVMMKLFGPEREKVIGDWRKVLMRSFTICTPNDAIHWENYYSGNDLQDM
jgi:hypothetical protein